MKLYELFIAFRYIKANFKQSIIITVAVGIGVAIIIWIPSINLSFIGDLIDKSVSSAPNIRIEKELDTFNTNAELFSREFPRKNILLSNQVLTRKRKIKSYRKIYEQIKNISQIQAVAPYAEGQAFLIRGGDERGVTISGITPDELKIIDIEKYLVQGRLRNIEINDIVIGQMLADKLKVNIGQRVNVIGPTGESRSLKIIGIYETGLRAKDEFQVYVNLDVGQQLLNIGSDVTGIGVRVKDIYQAEEVAKIIRARTGLYATSWMEDNKQVLEQLSRFKLIILFVNFLIMFSAATSITSVFIMLVAAKSKEIGILKSMGAKSSSIMSIFMSQAVFLSLAGYLIGLIGAKLMIIWYANMLESSPGTILSTQVPEISLNPFYAVIAFFYSVFASIIASALPAYQAAKLRPVEAINA